VNDWTIWQLADSALPSGGFAHSAGLEAAFQAGEVTTDAELRQFLVDSVWQAGHAMLPVVTSAHRDPSRIDELDALCEAFLTNAVANRASRVQGRAFLGACLRIWPSKDLEALDARMRSRCGHQAAIVGAALRLLGVPLETTQRLAIFTSCRGILAAAVRLGIVGPYRAQRLQHECGPAVGDVLSRCGALTDDDLAQTAPVIDLLQSSHDRLYSRLFQS
jgi:urease accessory protein